MAVFAIGLSELIVAQKLESDPTVKIGSEHITEPVAIGIDGIQQNRAIYLMMRPFGVDNGQVQVKEKRFFVGTDLLHILM